MLTEAKDLMNQSVIKKGQFRRAFRISWLGQTTASLAWIVSVFSYGISGTGDWLQLLAASSWFLANIAGLFESEHED